VLKLNYLEIYKINSLVLPKTIIYVVNICKVKDTAIELKNNRKEFYKIGLQDML
jgi:hypothetical protein